MIKLIRKLLGLCNHEWITDHKVQLTYRDQTVGFEYYQICQKCGEVRFKKSTCGSYKKFLNNIKKSS